MTRAEHLSAAPESHVRGVPDAGLVRRRDHPEAPLSHHLCVATGSETLAMATLFSALSLKRGQCYTPPHAFVLLARGD